MGNSKFNLRWFTPNSEVDLCGHATLATAHVLWEEGFLDHNQAARFDTRSGLLIARRGQDGIELDFPCEPVEREVSSEDERLILRTAIPAPIRFAGRNRFDILVELDDEDTVRNLRPNIRKLDELPVRGVIVTSRSSCKDYDFVSRFFLRPRLALTRSRLRLAHCCLGPYWSEKLGKSKLTARQVSRGGGTVKVSRRKPPYDPHRPCGHGLARRAGLTPLLSNPSPSHYTGCVWWRWNTRRSGRGNQNGGSS